ncbi:MAG: phenylalanine--tRNA ligase subunit beta [Paludibacteraceae bacterium]|nr:phenylalanine--tRNA ligase subunit beta [Paludibacteraceae bacterium]
MNISYNWLKRYIALKDDAQTVAKILTSIGLEVGTVENVQSIRGGLEGLVVGEVVTCIPHPNSDHLHITTTRVAPNEEPIQIVCGAPNVAAGQKVIVATIGTKLYDGDECFTIKRGKIRGEESLGMICAEDEIGVGTSHDGIMVLPSDTPVGLPAKEYFHLEDDTVIEVDITPNRNDGASHYGVARDLHAYYVAHGQDIALTRPDVSAFAVQNHNLPIHVTVENTDACPRYTGVTIAGVSVHESPDWLKKALSTIGLRPINNVVDATNFVLFEMGQALHAFDADKIEGQHIIIKNAQQGEKFVTLDGVERTLDARDLMICNANRPMCIAGVFGGQDSGVTEQTKNVFLESAYFDPVSIRKTARRHQLSTDASFRYERGCDPNNTLYVLQRCALLIQEVAGGQVAMDIADTHPEAFPGWEVEFDVDRAQRLMGKEIGEDTIRTILEALEIEVESQKSEVESSKCWTLTVPRYRVDVQRECDVVEDILRIYGYNNIEFPDKLNTSLSYGVKPNPEALQKRISEQLTAQGFNEIMNNSLTKVSYYEGEWLNSCVRIMNPLSQDLGVMRQTLLFGGLESIQRNVNRKNSNLKFYEFGHCYHYKSMDRCAEGVKSIDRCAEGVKSIDDVEPIQQYSEEPHLGLWITGNKSSMLSWAHKEEKTTFYQLHAIVNNILRRIGVAMDKVTLETAVDTNSTPCPLAACFADGLVIKAGNGKVLGYITIVAPKLLKQFDIDNPVYYADLDWNALLKQNKAYRPVINDLPKFPEVKRDLALLMNKDIQFADIARAAFDTERKLLKNVYLFDVYEGKNLDANKKSYALSFILQDRENTLKDQQIDNIIARLLKTFEDKFGASIRQ